MAALASTGKIGIKLPSINGHAVFKVKLGINGLGSRRGVRLICAVVDGQGWALSIYARQQHGEPPINLAAVIRTIHDDDTGSHSPGA